MSKQLWFPLGICVLLIILAFFLFPESEMYVTRVLEEEIKNPTKYAIFSFILLTSDIVLPIPSSVVMFINGYVMGILPGSILSILSLLLSATIGYYIGKLTSFGIGTKSEKKALDVISRYGALSILITRGIPVLAESVCFICGYNKIPFKRYFFLNLIGYIPICLLYGICGSMGFEKNLFFVSFGLSLLISIAFWFLGKKILKSEFTI